MNDEQTRAGFETLLLPLMKDAYNLSRWLMKNQEDAEDMVQESYLRAYRFLFTLPAGALADMVNRRKLLCFMNLWLAGAAVLLAFLGSFQLLNPYVLPLCVFLIGIGFAFHAPAWFCDCSGPGHRRWAAPHPSIRRFAKLFYPPREQSLASFNTTEPICSHTICSDRTTGTCLPRLNLPNITDHSRRWTSLNHKQ
jgi:hypothetical protein